MPVVCICENPTCGKTFCVKPSRIQRHPVRYCSYACWRPMRHLFERVWAKTAVCIHGTDCIFCCWDWQGARNEHDYGIIAITKEEKPRSNLVHRIAWEILNKKRLPDDLFGLHHCDRPPCCNGMHIHPGTQLQNMADAKSRGRRLGTGTRRVQGERVAQAKLHEEDIPLVFELRAQGWTIKAIGRRFGVSKYSISCILKGERWKHISLPIITAMSEPKLFK